MKWLAIVGTITGISLALLTGCSATFELPSVEQIKAVSEFVQPIVLAIIAVFQAQQRKDMNAYHAMRRESENGIPWRQQMRRRRFFRSPAQRRPCDGSEDGVSPGKPGHPERPAAEEDGGDGDGPGGDPAV